MGAAASGEAGWSKLAAFVTGGGTLLGLGSASETAQQLLNLPIQRVATTQPFSIGGSLLRETFDPTVPAAWGLPADGSTYFNGDRAWNVSDPTAKIAGAYPGTGNMLASGYEVGAEQLRGKADVVTLKAGRARSRSSARRRRSARGRARCGRWWPTPSTTGRRRPSARSTSRRSRRPRWRRRAASSRAEAPTPETAAPTTSAPDVKAEARAPVEAAATPAPAPARAPWPARRGEGHRLLQAGQEPARGDVHDQGRQGRKPARRPRARQGQGAPHRPRHGDRDTARCHAPEGGREGQRDVSPAAGPTGSARRAIGRSATITLR